jgi:hypothetical protein
VEEWREEEEEKEEQEEVVDCVSHCRLSPLSLPSTLAL